jgi:magnesium transporter
MSDSGLLALPIVDEKGRLIGALDACDIIRAMEQESTSGMYHLAGLAGHETAEQTDITSATSAGYRTLWLLGNLAIAFLLAWIISSFSSIIAGAAILAAFIPLSLRAAGQAGMQSLTFIVRSLSLGQVDADNQRHILHREMMNGLINGLLMGGVAGVLVGFWQGSVVAGLIIGVAVLVNLLLAVVAGTSVPLLCKALHINPSRVSALLVTTLTDMGGLVLLFGLATLALQYGYL